MKFLNYLNEVKSELSKITWPKKEEVIKLTLIVFFFSGIVAVYVGGVDLIFTKLLEKLLIK
jgi:preprotein translocase subunit SecE